jgi:hypothetical protein
MTSRGSWSSLMECLTAIHSAEESQKNVDKNNLWLVESRATVSIMAADECGMINKEPPNLM